MKEKYKIQTTYEFWVIMTVFSLAGMAIVWVRKPLFHILGIGDHTPFIIKFLVWLAIVFPTYQINLLLFGFLLGQFPFFWEREKKLWEFLLRGKMYKASDK